MKPWDVSWTNFRGFEKAASLRFPRLTLLIGRNNVGKTSAYAPLLLLKQTLDARDPRTTLLTRGELLDAGSFDDLVTDHDISRTLTFSVGLNLNSEESRSHQDHPIASSLETSFSLEGEEDIVVTKSRILDRNGKPIVTRTRRKGSPSYTVSSSILPKTSGVGRPLREIADLRRELSSEQPEGFLFNGMRALVIPRTWRHDRDRWDKAREWLTGVSDLVDIQWDVNHEIRRRLGAISYLGPLRSLPKRTYQISAERPTEVGRDGEFAPELLLRSASEDVKGQVDEWLLKLGYGHLAFEMRGDDFFQVYLRSDSRSLQVNLAHCGVGLSQLLPTLVQGATTPKSGTLISQQPEIHLNPAQQCLVTDFLIDTALSHRRVIVETHSEHILLRLRRRIAEGKISNDDVAVYFCDSRDGRSFVERVSMGERAELSRSEWPKGFFEEQLEDSMALAMAQI